MRQKDEERDTFFFFLNAGTCQVLAHPDSGQRWHRCVYVKKSFWEIGSFLPVELKSDTTWNENVWHQDN